MIPQIANILSKYGLDITHVEIEERYDEPHRYYHTFKHIEFLINRINNLFEKGLINEEERDILILAALFHDIVYNPQRSDNELQSVNLLKSKVFLKMTPELEKICEIILATSSHEKSGDKLTDIFCDLDMWFLTNGTFVEIAEDERNIFKEYQFVDYSTYKKERTKFLGAVMNSDYGIDNTWNLNSLIKWVLTQKISVGVYAGSFNPFHNGHLDILKKGQDIFDKVILAIGVNPEKANSPEYIETLKSNIQELKEKLNVEVCFYDGLLTDFIQEKIKIDNINITLIRGLRDGFDLAYENRQIQFMKDIYPELKTVYIQSDRNLDHISSSAIRYLNKYDPNLSKKYLP